LPGKLKSIASPCPTSKNDIWRDLVENILEKKKINKIKIIKTKAR
jgi:hypothetical protein